MRRVESLERTYNNDKRTDELFIYVSRGKIGRFHGFGIDYEEFESGPGMFTTAVVELPDGTVKNVYVECIKFLDKE